MKERLRVLRARVRRGGYSRLGEQEVASRLLALHGADHWAVDIAAYDGLTNSNVFALYEAGWRGLAVEGDPGRFASLARIYRDLSGVSLARTWVTPETVVPLLQAHGVPTSFGFLNLDIDGYDHFVLDALLHAYRPVVVCAEINETIPPPLKFTVLFDPDYSWAEDHFFGQSIAKLDELALAHDYALVELHYNNAFLVPAERARVPRLTPEDAYRTGYLERPDRLRLFPWNADMEPVHELDTEGKLSFVQGVFARYAGRYELTV